MNGARVLLTAINDIDDRFILDVPGAEAVAMPRRNGRRRLLSVLLPAAILAMTLMLTWIVILKMNDSTLPTPPGDGTLPGEDVTQPEDPLNMVIQNGILLSYTGTEKVFTVPDGVTGIGKDAFSNANVELLYLTPQVSHIEEGALDGIQSVELTEGSSYYFMMDSVLISVGENKPVFIPAAALSTTYYFPEGTTVIDDVGDQLQGYTLVILPDSVREIRPYAFQKCHKLRVILLNEGLETIGWGAFLGCERLKMINIPKGVTRIEEQTFQFCAALERVIFEGDRITAIDRRAFYDCRSLKRIDIPFVGASVAADAFTGAACEYLGPGKWIGDGYYNGNILVKADTDLTGCFTVEEGTKILEEGAFQNARFDQILLPDTVERIRDNCFRDCDKLLEIRLPASVVWVAETAFVGCNLLERIDMEDGNLYGFFSRDGVLYHKNTLIAYPSGKKDTRVTIYEEITALASHSFYGQRYLKELVMEAPTVTLKGSCLGDCLVLERITFAGGDIGFSAEDAGEMVFAKSSFLREVRILGIPSAPMPSALLSSAKSLTDVYFAGTKQQWETLGCDLKETVILHDNYQEEK